MAVVDELITRIGFEVTGTDELKKAQKAKEEVEKSFLQKRKGGKDWQFNDPESRRQRKQYWREMAMQRVQERRGTLALLRMTGALRTIAIGATIAVGGLVLALAKAASMLISVGAAAAKARREMQVSAKAMGTSAQAMDVLTNFFSVFSIGRDAAQEWAKTSVKAISEVVDAAKKGDAEAKKKLLDLGPGVAFDKNGKIRDASAISYNATQQAKKLKEQADEARKKGQTKRADALELQASKSLTTVGLSKEAQVEVLNSNIKSGEFYQKTKAQSSLHPTWSDTQEERAERVAKKWNEVSDKFGAISGAIIMKFQQLGIGLADGVLPIIDKILDAIIRFGKATGLLPETQQDKNDRIQDRIDNIKGGDARANAAWSGGFKKDQKGNWVDEPISSGELLVKILADQLAGGVKTSQSRDTVGWDRVFAGYSPNELGPGASTSYNNVGNDQRNVTNNLSTTVNATIQSAESLGGVVEGAVKNSAPSLIKGSNGSTATTPKP